MKRALLAGLAVTLLTTIASAEISQQGWTIERIRQSEVTPAITAAAVQILRDHRQDPYGTDVPFTADGKPYVGRIERHYHPPGGPMRPWGYHKGVSVFRVVSTTPGTPPTATDALEPVRQGRLLLRRGSRGAAVQELQRRLTAVGHPLTADGIFGPLTQAAVRRFQSRSGLVTDGLVGRLTVGALDRASAPTPSGR